MMTALEFILSLRPAVPMSIERPCTLASNGEVKRWLLNKAVHVNGAAVRPEDEVCFPVTALVFFPKSAARRTTVI